MRRKPTRRPGGARATFSFDILLGTGQEGTGGGRGRPTQEVIGANEREVTRNLRYSALPNWLVRSRRQDEPQRGSHAGTAAGRDLTAVGFDQAPGDGQAEAGAA